MKRSTTLAVGLLMCSGASAAPFHALSYEAGGGLPGVTGQGFSVDFGGFFTADGAGNNVFGASAASMTAGNEFQFDSHSSLDGFGPSARNRTTTPANNSTLTTEFYGDYGPPGPAGSNYDELDLLPPNGFGPFTAAGAAYIAGPGSHIGDPTGDGSTPENSARAAIAVSPPPVLTHFAPNTTGGRSVFNGVFVGRFTIKPNATLSGGIRFSTLAAEGVFDTHDLTLGGPAALFNTHNGPQFLSLRAYRLTLTGPVTLTNPSASIPRPPEIPEPEPFGAADVYDLWVQVPGPGAAMLVTLGIMFAGQRR